MHILRAGAFNPYLLPPGLRRVRPSEALRNRPGERTREEVERLVAR